MKKGLAFVLTIALLCALLAGCSAGSKGLSANRDYAKEKISDFSHYYKRNTAKFADDMFCKANIAAMMITDKTTDEDYEKIARNLSLDSITVADATRTVVGSYPEDEKDKNLKELSDKKDFAAIVRNTADKQMTDPVYDEESGQYSLLAGVKRSDGTGVVIIGLKTDEYADVNGDNLAEKCGNNMIVLKDGTVISSTLDGVIKGDTLDIVKLTDDDLKKDSFSFTSDGTSYTAISATEGDYTVICAEPK